MKSVILAFATFAACAALAAGPGGGGMPPGGGGNQPGGGGSQPGGNQPGGPGGSSATFTFDTFLAASTTNTSKCVIREGKWTGWTSGITAATLDSSVSNLAVGVCAGCTTLTSVDLSACTTLAEIPDSAFAGCTALKEVALPASCTTIGANAFAGCSKLATLTAPGVTTVGSDAFRACSALAALPTALNAAGVFSFAQSGVTSVNLNGITAGEGAFSLCSSLAVASNLPSELPAALFAGDTALAAVDISGCTAVGAAALAGCDALTTLTLSPSAVLGDYALAANEATVVTTLGQSTLPACADTCFLGREVSYMPVAGSVTRIEAVDLVDWLSDAAASAGVVPPADCNTATLKAWLSDSDNALAYAYAAQIASATASGETFLPLGVNGSNFVFAEPDSGICISVHPAGCYTLSSDASDWTADNLTWSDADNAYVATDATQSSCFARLRFTWDW